MVPIQSPKRFFLEKEYVPEKDCGWDYVIFNFEKRQVKRKIKEKVWSNIISEKRKRKREDEQVRNRFEIRLDGMQWQFNSRRDQVKKKYALNSLENIETCLSEFIFEKKVHQTQSNLLKRTTIDKWEINY